MLLIAAEEFAYEFGSIFIFVIAAVGFVFGSLLASWLVRPRRPTEEMMETYECGEDPVGSAWTRMNLRFYLVGLVFVLFDVEMVFVFPIAALYRDAAPDVALFVFAEVAAFITILFLGLVYAWRKGDLDWIRRAPGLARRESSPAGAPHHGHA
ncbi:MAG: NADH-quinone oxidoreductase subunit A [Planctomycetes bacterium]|nr:NADH-quinone oxidoreductase subunit A [Planctomycetota bacterium]